MSTKSTKSQLEGKTVLQLKKLASKKDVQGRSTMKKSQLVKALMKGGMKGGNRRLNGTDLTLEELQAIIRAKYAELSRKEEAGEEITHNDYMYYVKPTYNSSTHNITTTTSVLTHVGRFIGGKDFEIIYYSIPHMNTSRNIARVNQLILSTDGSTIIHIYHEEGDMIDFDNIIHSTENEITKRKREEKAVREMKSIDKYLTNRRNKYMETGDPCYLPGAEIEAVFERLGRSKKSKSKAKAKTYEKPRKGNSTHNFRRNFNNHEPVYENENEYGNYQHLEYNENYPNENNWWYPPNQNNEEENYEENYEDYFAGNNAGNGAGYGASGSTGTRPRNVNINELYNNEEFQTFLRTNPQNKKTYRQLYFGLSRKYHPNRPIKNGAAASKETMNALKAKRTKQFQEIGRVKAEKESKK